MTAIKKKSKKPLLQRRIRNTFKAKRTKYWALTLFKFLIFNKFKKFGRHLSLVKTAISDCYKKVFINIKKISRPNVTNKYLRISKRLDYRISVVVQTLGFTQNVSETDNFLKHGYFLINGKIPRKTDLLKIGDIVTLSSNNFIKFYENYKYEKGIFIIEELQSFIFTEKQGWFQDVFLKKIIDKTNLKLINIRNI